MKPKHTLFILIISCCINSPLSACNVLLLGDSISSGYGITTQKTWANLLSSKLTEHDASLTNLSVSGYTSRSGLELLLSHLEKNTPSIVILELGGNDALQFISPTVFNHHLQAIDALSNKHQFKLVVLGIELPPNMPEGYRVMHQKAYQELLKKHPGTLNLLEEVEKQGLFQPDRIHPNNDAQSLILEKAWPHIELALKSQCASDNQ